jgi:hypothetical protein
MRIGIVDLVMLSADLFGQSMRVGIVDFVGMFSARSIWSKYTQFSKCRIEAKFYSN